MQQENAISDLRAEILPGTLDLMILKSLEAMGPLHSYAIAQRLEQVSRDTVRLNQGTVYPALMRLEQKGWINFHWGLTAKNRRAKYYSITPSGRRQLAAETESWSRLSAFMARLLQTKEES